MVPFPPHQNPVYASSLPHTSVLYAPPISLVEPELEIKIGTLDELDSDKSYGHNPGLNIASHSMTYPELWDFNKRKKLGDGGGDIKG